MPLTPEDPPISPGQPEATTLDHARARPSPDRLVVVVQACRNVVQQQPYCFEAYQQLGTILLQLNRFEEALGCLQRARQLRPDFPKLNLTLGAVLKKLRRLDEAAACCLREIELNPEDADAHYNLGLVRQCQNDLPGAIAAYQAALRLRPGYIDALINQGVALREHLRPTAALRCFEEAIRRDPDNAEARWERCTTWLSLGEFERGWKEYEWRWRLKDFPCPPPRVDCPRWDGSPLQGRRILVDTEQGFGDAIQFLRYVPLIADRGGEVILGCPAPLRSLAQTVPGVREVVTSRTAGPSFDVYSPLMSLPAIFGTGLASIPAQVPYLAPPPGDLGFEPPSSPGLKIGIAWAGDPKHPNDQNRSLPPERLRVLAEIPGAHWYSLQAGLRAADLERLGLKDRITDLGSGFRDFGDTARAIAQMDLVVSVDTAVAHLAGALAKPVWTLLPYAAEWRWQLGCLDSPWYPTMRLFRQSAWGDWPELIRQVRSELLKLVQAPQAGIN